MHWITGLFILGMIVFVGIFFLTRLVRGFTGAVDDVINPRAQRRRPQQQRDWYDDDYDGYEPTGRPPRRKKSQADILFKPDPNLCDFTSGLRKAGEMDLQSLRHGPDLSHLRDMTPGNTNAKKRRPRNG